MPAKKRKKASVPKKLVRKATKAIKKLGAAVKKTVKKKRKRKTTKKN